MKKFKFLSTGNERSEAFENLMDMLHDMDRGLPGDDGILSQIKDFMYVCYCRNNPQPPLELDWGVINMRGIQSRPDGMGGTELFGMVIVTIVGRQSYYQSVTVSNIELDTYRLLDDYEN
jgi:hypothetical protein